MDETHFMERRRQLIAALVCAALLPSSAFATKQTAGRAAPTAPAVPELQLPDADMTPQLFLTMTSKVRSADALEQVLVSGILPALAKAGVTQAWNPVSGAIQLWVELDPILLDSKGLGVEDALPLLAAAMQAEVVPLPGRNTLQAWALQRPETAPPIDPMRVVLALPGDDEAPLASISSSLFTMAPPEWDGQTCISAFFASAGQDAQALEKRCMEQLAAAGDAVPKNVEVQLGRVSEVLKTVSTVYVSVLQEDDVPAF